MSEHFWTFVAGGTSLEIIPSVLYINVQPQGKRYVVRVGNIDRDNIKTLGEAQEIGLKIAKELVGHGSFVLKRFTS